MNQESFNQSLSFTAVVDFRDHNMAKRYWLRKAIWKTSGFLVLIGIILWAVLNQAVPAVMVAIWPEQFEPSDQQIWLSAVIVCGFGVWTWSTANGLGRLLVRHKRPLDTPDDGFRDGVSRGLVKFAVNRDGLSWTYNYLHDEMHFASIKRVFRWCDLILVKQRWPEIHYTAHPSGKSQATKFVRAIRKSKKQTSSDGWRFPEDSREWAVFELPSDVYETSCGSKKSSIGLVSHIFLTGVNIFVAGLFVVAARNAGNVGEQLVFLFLGACFLPALAFDIPWLWQGVKRRIKGLSPFGSAIPGYSCGKTAYRVRSGGIDVRRVFLKRSFDDQAISIVEEDEGWATIRGGDQVLAVLPCSDALRQHFVSAGFSPEGGSWGAQDQNRKWLRIS
jgi:hypothetical protein